MKSSQGKALKKNMGVLGHEAKQFAGYMGDIVKKAAREGLKYGEADTPVTSRV